MEKRGVVIWLTGLSGAGKTTIGNALSHELASNKIAVTILDGDDIRKGISKDLGFSLEDREENIRRVATMANANQIDNKICICCFISPTIKIRKIAENIIGKENFFEIHVDTPLDICEKRDVKGLYKKARAGEISNFTGIHSIYEAPLNPFLTLLTTKYTVNELVGSITQKLSFNTNYLPTS